MVGSSETREVDGMKVERRSQRDLLISGSMVVRENSRGSQICGLNNWMKPGT